MSNPINRPEADELDQLLEQWIEQLPGPPAHIARTLGQLRASQNKPARVRLAVLAAMAAAIVVVLTGGLTLLFASFSKNSSLVSTPLSVSNLPVATARAELPNVAYATSSPTPAATPAISVPSPLLPSAATTAATFRPSLSARDGPPSEEPTAEPTATTQPVVPSTAEATVPPTIDDAPRNPVPPIRTATSGPAKAVTTATFTPVPVVIGTATPVPPEGAVVTGAITTLDGSGLTLNTNPERIILTSATKIVANQKAVPFSALVVGQYVTVQANRNSQGQLVAQLVTIVLKSPPRMPAEK